MRIVFLGPPGSGKGTQAQRLKDYLQIVHLSTGEMLRQAHEAGTTLGIEAARFMNAGQLVPDDMVVRIVADRIRENDCQRGCLFDGFPRTVPQAQALDQLLTQRGTPLNLVIALEVSEPLLVERLLARGRADDDQQTIRERFRQYSRQTQPLLDYYASRGVLARIVAEGCPDDVFEQIRAAVETAAGAPK
ncbi:MAG: adenylate kinase [Pirellulales bacterium]|nr:adenylate kinase [Pirellulales bacterium]